MEPGACRVPEAKGSEWQVLWDKGELEDWTRSWGFVCPSVPERKLGGGEPAADLLPEVLAL